MALYSQNSEGWGFPLDEDARLYMTALDVDCVTAERIVRIQKTDPAERSTQDTLFLRSLLLRALGDPEEVGFIDGQLLPHGATKALIVAVRSGNDTAILTELRKVSNPDERRVLHHIIQCMGPILGRQR